MRWSRATLLLFCFCVFLLGLGDSAITDSDEAFYAEASREMGESRDWLTPHFNYEDRWQKPVLYYWLTAATYIITGPTAAAARLWAALSGVGLALLTWSAAYRVSGDRRVAWISGAIVATCFGYFAMARAALPDLPLAFCITLCISSALAAIDGKSRAWIWAGLGAGLGFLVKGPVALVIPAVVLVPIAWRERTRVVVSPSGVAVALAVFAVVGLPWYLAMLSTHGTAYAQSFFIGDNLERFATGRFNEPRPVWFYLPVVLGGLLPWSPYAVTLAVTPVIGLVRRVRALDTHEWRLIIWALMPIVFYTISIGKQPRYVLPVLPPLAILLGWAMSRRAWGESQKAPARNPALRIATWTSVAQFSVAAVAMVRLGQTGLVADARVAWMTVAALLICAVALAVVAVRSIWRALPVTMAISGTVLLVSIQFSILARPRPEPVEQLAALVRQHRTANEAIGAYRAFVRNLVFYTGVRQQDLYDEAHALEFVKSSEPVLLVLPEDEVPGLELRSGIKLRRLETVSYVNTANIRLRTLLRDDPAVSSRVLLVTNR